jgi:hypothetical protein
VRAADVGGQPVLVIPARPRVVQFAQDLAQLKPLTLIAAQSVPGSDEIVMHQWINGEWHSVDWESYRRGSFPVTPVGPLMIVGDRSIVATDVAEEALWAPAVKRVETVNIADLINFFGPTLELSTRQMRWLSKRYDVQLTDLNADRRRWGRYGPPGQERPQQALPPLRQDDDARAVPPIQFRPAGASVETPKGDGTAMPPAPATPKSLVRSDALPAPAAHGATSSGPEKGLAPVEPVAPPAMRTPEKATPAPAESTLPSPVFPEDK